MTHHFYSILFAIKLPTPDTIAAVHTVPTSPGAISHPHNPTALPRTHTRGNLPTLLCSRVQQCPKKILAVAVSETRLCLQYILVHEVTHASVPILIF
jgi:hypothetical protein